jgi:urease accessory protein
MAAATTITTAKGREKSMSTEKLARLLQLASPTLPVGAYSYSQGLEAAIEAGVVRDAGSARRWIGDVLRLSVGRTDAPLFLRMCNGRDCNDLYLATRETAELRAETVQMGYSLARLLRELGIEVDLDEPSYPAAMAKAVRAWRIDPQAALVAYLWSWLENQVMAAVKAVPLGQTDGQKMLLALGDGLDQLAKDAASMDDDDIGAFTPGLGLLSSLHETQYSRMYRS